jgi:hypothetical protein
MDPRRSRLSDPASQTRAARPPRLARAALALGAAVALAAGAGCVETTVERPGASDRGVREVPASGGFEVRAEGALVGQVQRYSNPSDPQQHYFVVMNPWGQELGIVDGLGRVWRRRPHEEEPEAIGSGPLADGVRRLLGLDAPVELVAVPPAG